MMIETKEQMLEMDDCGEEYKIEQVRFILGSDIDRDLKDTYLSKVSILQRCFS